MSNTTKVQIHENAAEFYSHILETFYQSYMGNEIQYYNGTTGEWVDADSANYYPEEITDYAIIYINDDLD